MMALKEVHTSSNVSAVHCDLCLSTFGLSNFAETFCVNCSIKLCDKCCKYHKTLGATKDHILIQDRDTRGKSEKTNSKNTVEDSINKRLDNFIDFNYKTLDITKSCIQSHDIVPPLRGISDKIDVTDSLEDDCDAHPNNFTEYYCEFCDEFCCSLCIKSTHATCKNKELITKDINDDNDAKAVLDILLNMEKEMEKNKSKLTSTEQKIKDLHETARSRINFHREALTNLIARIYTDFETSLIKLEHDSRFKVESASKLHNTLTLGLESLILEVQNAQQGGKCGLVKTIKKVHKELPSLQSSLKKLDSDDDIETYFCNVSKKTEQIVSYLKELERMVQGACIRMQHH